MKPLEFAVLLAGLLTLPACNQGWLGWRRPRASLPMLGAPPKPATRSAVTVEELPCKSICNVEPINMSQA